MMKNLNILPSNLLALFFLVASTFYYGQTNRWNVPLFSSDWNTPGNWSLGVVPTVAHDVVIPYAFIGNNPTINSFSAVAKSVTIQSGMTLNLTNNAASILNIKENFTNNGALSAGAASTINFDGATASTIAGSSSSSFGNLTINKSANGTTVTNNALAFSVQRILNVTRGNLVLAATNVDYTVGDNLTIATNGTLSHIVDWDTGKKMVVDGNIAIDGIYSTNGIRTNVNMTTSGKTVRTGTNPSSAFRILTLSHTSGTITASGLLTVNDNFWAGWDVNGGAFSTGVNMVNANNELHNGGGSITIPNGGILNVTGGFNVGRATKNGSVVLQAGGILNADVLSIGDGTNTGVFSHTGGTANIGNVIINATGANNYTCSTVGPQTINISGNWTNNRTFTAGTSSTVNFTGTSARLISGTLSGANGRFYNLAFNGVGGSWTNNAPIDVANTLTMTNGILNTTTPTNIINVTKTASTAIVGGSSNSFVNGPIRWTLPANLGSGSTYNYPVGKGGRYLPFSLINPITGAVAPTSQVEAFSANSGGSPIFAIPSTPTTLGSISNTEYWSLLIAGNFTSSSVSIIRPTAISPFDAIGGSTSVNGTYSSLNGTVGVNGITISSLIGANRFFTLARKNGIRIDGSITPTIICASATVTVPFKITAPFIGANVFTAQLSDASGSFASPTNIGILTQQLSGVPDPGQTRANINATIPNSTPAGSGYRIRVISSVPNVIGEDNGSNITITAINSTALSSAAGTNNQALCIGKAITPVTFTTAGATGIGTAVSLPAGLTASFSANTITITGIPTVSGTFNYSIPLVGGCGTVNATGTIAVNAATTFNSGLWSNGLPDANKKAVFASDYTTTTSEEMNVCSCEVKNSGILKIKANSSLTVQNEITNLGTADNFIIESDGNLIQINPSKTINSGTITAERNVTLRYNPLATVPAVDFVYWGAPVEGQRTKGAGGFSPGTLNSQFADYRESNDRFYETSDVNFMPAKGYSVQAERDKGASYNETYKFKGTPNNGDFSRQIIRSPDNPVGNVHGYNLVANPYPSNIKFSELYLGNSGLIWNTAWFWTNATYQQYQQGSNYKGNNYAVLNGTGGLPATIPSGVTYSSVIPNGIVKVGQGFLVQKKDVGTAPLNFKNSYGIGHDLRVADAGAFFHKNANEINRYWLKLIAPSTLVNSQLIGYVQGATDNFEQDFDAEIFGLSSDLFYSIIPDKKLLIQGRNYNFMSQDKVDLGANFFQTGNYTIELGDKEGIFANGQNIYLKDKQAGIITDLTQSAYVFTANAGETNARFEIIYEPETVLATDAASKEQLVVYRENGDFVIKSPKEMERIEVYETSGKLIKILLPNSKSAILEGATLINGMYLLKIKTKEGVIVTKKIMR